MKKWSECNQNEKQLRVAGFVLIFAGIFYWNYRNGENIKNEMDQAFQSKLNSLGAIHLQGGSANGSPSGISGSMTGFSPNNAPNNMPNGLTNGVLNNGMSNSPGFTSGADFRCARYTVPDPTAAASDHCAGPFSVLVPQGWQANGGVQWTLQLPEPAYVSLTVEHPDGIAVGVVPRRMTSTQGIASEEQVANWVASSLNIKGEGWKSGGLRPVPMYGVNMALLPMTVQGQYNGKPVLVKTTVIVANVPNGLTAYTFVPLVIMGSNETLTKHMAEVAMICSSIRVNPQWHHVYMQVMAQLTKQPASGPDVEDVEAKKAQDAFDHANEDWDKYIRGTVDVFDTDGKKLMVGEVGKSYWKSGGGDVAITADGHVPRDASNYTKLPTH